MDATMPKGSRLLSAGELVLGAVVVLGHNLFGVLPNEVPILVILGLVSVRLRNGGIAALGLRRPASIRRVVFVALAAAALRITLDVVVIDPVVSRLWPSTAVPEDIAAIAGNPLVALKWLAVVWTFAAFGEEISYRGYLLTRAADLGGRSIRAYWLGVVLVAVLFGIGHYWNGPGGMISSGTAGLVLGAAYMATGRNLWTPVLAHGLIDTFSLAMLYFGWSS